MRTVLVNTGTELLLGDVQDRHLSFIAREIFPLGILINEQRTVPDGNAIGETLRDLFARAEVIFVTGGLGPTSDDVTREIVAELLGLELRQDEQLLATITERLAKRGIRSTSRIPRQADVPVGARVVPNGNGTAPGLYLRENINPKIHSPHLFLLPGPPRELQPMFRDSVMSILREIVPASSALNRRLYTIAMTGESIVEKAIGEKILAIPGLELGYCARPGEVDVRIVGDAAAVERANTIIHAELGSSIFSTSDETLEEVLVKLLTERKETIALAESCTGGLLAHRMTNVPGASAVFLASYVTYENAAKIDILNVDSKLIAEHGAVSEPVVRAMADGARTRTRSTYALATTGIAGPAGGSEGKPVGTVYVALAAANETMAKKYFFPNDRATFKQMTAQAAFEMLRRTLIA
jgi:nicotinamide-nucleotide amidase